MKRRSCWIVRRHAPQKRALEKTSARHRRQPTRLRHSQNVRVPIKNSKTRRRLRLHPRRPMPPENRSRRELRRRHHRGAVHKHAPRLNPPTPSIHRRMRIPPNQVVQHRDPRSGAVQTLFITIPTVEHWLDIAETAPRLQPTGCWMLPQPRPLPNHVHNPSCSVGVHKKEGKASIRRPRGATVVESSSSETPPRDCPLAGGPFGARAGRDSRSGFPERPCRAGVSYPRPR